MNLFYNKPKKVINAVTEFYNGKITKFPYTPEEVQQAKNWLTARTMTSQVVVERLNMIQVLIGKNVLN